MKHAKCNISVYGSSKLVGNLA